MDLSDLERLDAHHDLTAFDAGPDDTEGQSAWLKDHGITNEQRGLTRTFVTTYAGTSRVGAFFGLSAAVITRADLSRRLRPHGTPPFIPATLIARLGVDRPLQGQGLGRDLVLAALSRAVRAQNHVGSALVVVDAAGDDARRLYARHAFTALTDASGRTTRMVLPMATVREMLQVP